MRSGKLSLDLGGMIAAGMLATLAASPLAAQVIQLSTINAGSGGNGFVMNGQGTDDYSGFTVAGAGDVNGDGRSDVIVGTRGGDVTGGGNEGRAYVVFGKSTQSAIQLVTIAGGASTLGFVINGGDIGDQAGFSVSGAGDVNGDGLADVIVGAPSYGASAIGRSYVVFGKTSGSPIELSAFAGGVSGQGFAITGQANSDLSGAAVSAAGDVNGDGRGDLIVGAYASDPPGGSSAGRSYVVFGKTSSSMVQLSALGAAGFEIDGESTGDDSGRRVCSAGDVNGDGRADIVIGAPSRGSDTGRAYVVFGKTSTSTVFLSAVATGTSGLGFAMTSDSIGDLAGSSVSGAGDTNGDGLADIIVGAPGEDLITIFQIGRAYVVFGKTNDDAVQLSNLFTTPGAEGWSILGDDAGDGLGSAVSGAGDVNGDGLADLVVGARDADAAGVAYVVYGKTTNLNVSASAIATGTSTLGFFINGATAGDEAGFSVAAAGDVDGDGLADVVVGSPYADISLTNVGRSYTVFSPVTSPPISATYNALVLSGNAPNTGIGTNRYGADRTVHPDARLWADFDAGTNASVTAIITRNDSGITGFAPADMANVQWNLSTTRTGFTQCRVTVRYTNAELGSMPESVMQLFSAPTAAGPFTAVSSFTLDTARNEASGIVTSLPRVFLFAIPESAKPTSTVTRSFASPNANQIAEWTVTFSEPVAPSFTIGDITPSGSLSGSVVMSTLTGTDPNYIVRMAVNSETTNGFLGFNVATSSVTNTLGVPMAPMIVPACNIVEPGSVANGDVNKDGTVNTADITTLGNHIANGDPLP